MLLYPRAVAHFVDVCVVQGFSVYGAKFFSVAILSLYAGEISGTGRGAGAVFRDAFSYSSAQLLAASCAALSVLYFIGLPLLMGRTLGQGLMGLRIVSDGGQPLTLRQLCLRMVGCVLSYASGGILCLVGLRQRDGRFLHDVISDTRVVKD
jgi:uncharacterized RDD family membrane protein YckC